MRVFIEGSSGKVEEASALRAGDDFLVGTEGKAGLGGHLHVATRADIVLDGNDGAGVFCFEKALVAFDQILVKPLQELRAGRDHFVDADFQIAVFFTKSGDLGVEFRLFLGMGFVSGCELRGKVLSLLHEDEFLVLDAGDHALGGFNFMGEGRILLVLAGLELLGFVAVDLVALGGNFDFEIFLFDFDGFGTRTGDLEAVSGVLDKFLLGGDLGGDRVEFEAEGAEALIAVLEGEEFFDGFEHGGEIEGARRIFPAIKKDFFAFAPLTASQVMSDGICYLVGAGPGDPLLLTLKGRQCLERAGVVVYDYLCNPDLLKWAPPGAERIYVGKKSGAHTMRQEEIADLLVEKIREGKTVVRLKGGDPFVFGRGGEEAEALAQAGCRFEVVPGISSAISGPAYAGIPVTHRSHNAVLTIFTGHEDPEKTEASVDYAAIASAPGTKVMLMGIERLEAITTRLREAGMGDSTPVALIRWATTGRQQTLAGTLGDIAQSAKAAAFEAPAVVVFGDVVGLRDSLNWFEKLPLFGKRIAVTRTLPQAGELAAKLRELGADAFELPTIRIEPAPGKREFFELVAYAHSYDWLVFTSPNGADAFFQAFYELYKDARSIGGVRVAAIGPATAARVRANRFEVDLQPEKHLSMEILPALQKETTIDNLKILLVRGESADRDLPKALSRLGAIIDEAIAYRTVPETDANDGVARYRREGADMVTFTSASTAENFNALGLPKSTTARYASIGPVTSKAMRDLGMSVDVEARSHDTPGLIRALVDFFEPAG
jgi:uroporphyrinogen III methyltransferase/synthase